MTGLHIEAELHGEEILSRRLLRFTENMTDARHTVWPRVVRILALRTARAFSTRGAALGQPWEDLTPATIARKQRDGLDPRILRATNRLYDSLIVDTNADHVDDRTTDSLLWGTQVPYAGVHQDPRGRSGRIPRRPFIGFDEVTRRLIVKAVHAGIMRGQ